MMDEIVGKNLEMDNKLNQLELENKSMNEIINRANEENIKLKDEKETYLNKLNNYYKKIRKINKISGVTLIISGIVFFGIIIFNITYYLLSR